MVLVRSRATGEPWVLKIVHASSGSVQREAARLAELRHPLVVPLEAVFSAKTGLSGRAKEDQEAVVLQMPYLSDGNLRPWADELGRAAAAQAGLSDRLVSSVQRRHRLLGRPRLCPELSRSLAVRRIRDSTGQVHLRRRRARDRAVSDPPVGSPGRGSGGPLGRRLARGLRRGAQGHERHHGASPEQRAQDGPPRRTAAPTPSCSTRPPNSTAPRL